MRISFGWRSFKIKSFSLQDFGIKQDAASDVRIEVLQQYFHIVWIPFFSLGKKWIVRKGNKMYELPLEIELQVTKSPIAAAVRTPFYTYAGPILIVLGLLIYKANDRYLEYHHKQVAIKSFNDQQAALQEKLQHLTIKDFINVTRLSKGGSDTTIYLKVADVQADKIVVKPVQMPNYVDGFHASPWEVEYQYTQDSSLLPAITVSNQQLQAAAQKEFNSGPSGVNLLNDGTNYVITGVVRHWGPILTVRHTGGYSNTEISIDMINDGWPATITDIKELKSNGNWSENINKELRGRKMELEGSVFTLDATRWNRGWPYKLLMTLKDTTGQLHRYEIAGVDLKVAVKEL
jgi:hypothetical protein